MLFFVCQLKISDDCMDVYIEQGQGVGHGSRGRFAIAFSHKEVDSLQGKR